MFRLGPTELIIILLIVILLFGAGRIGRIAGELGKGIRNFREGLKGDENSDENEEEAKEEKKE
jgi:sec-independent protein translocase protein TatA